MTNSCLSCHYCRESLFGERILRDDNPYCLQCYHRLFVNICEDCKQAIAWDGKDLEYKDHHWHEACFKCATCACSLSEKPFAVKDELLMCTECYSNKYSSKCYTCKKTIMPGARKMKFKGNSWHESCFTCLCCQQPIGTKPFIPKDKENYCVSCFEREHDSQCQSCKKAITSGGVTYRNQPWHEECFLCASCKKQLAGQQFTSRDEVPHCLDCFSSLYCKKCEACSKPITGLGGAKYISFENRQWHSECFTCRRCNISLVGQGFLTHKDNILCPACGRDEV
ncbi:four and a half LIM domains protein 5 [Rhinatrema bivittatum]|uniref:four and a half LIM domains protein 5 n=1 Tax=Rhinatrema bivittatum TaxID=194408 RepID=UPI00112B8643|nr:four and a half LIM domains protein 5 [Rhinatrema bivittatum]